MGTRYQLATILLDLGFSVLPLSPRSKRPGVKWKRYQTEKPTDADLRAWFLENDFRPGIVTGAVSGVVVIDVDADEIPPEADSVRATSVRQRTRRGCHFIFRHPGHRVGNRARVEGLPVDVRGDGGYVVAYEDCWEWTQEQLQSAPVLG